jgi:hypothetical protein
MPAEVNPPDPEPSSQQPLTSPATTQGTSLPSAFPPAPPWITQLLDNQARDIQLRGDQLQLARQQEQHSFEFAQNSLNAQVVDRRDERQMRDGAIRYFGRMIVLVVFMILAFLGTLTLTGHGDIALELAKIVVYGGLGAAGGYGYGRTKGQTPQQ